MTNPQLVGTLLCRHFPIMENINPVSKTLFFVKYTIGKEFFTCPVERELQSFKGKLRQGQPEGHAGPVTASI